MDGRRKMKPIDLTNPYDKYLSYLQSKTWADLRNAALERDNYHCSICRSPYNLEVHHLRYPKTLGTEPISDLMTLCDKCHERLENWKKGHKTDGKVFRWKPPRKNVWVRVKDCSEGDLLVDKCKDYLSNFNDTKIIFYAQKEQCGKEAYCSDEDLPKIEELLSGYEIKTTYK